MLELLTSEEQCQKFLTALRKLDNNTLSICNTEAEYDNWPLDKARMHQCQKFLGTFEESGQ